MLEEIIRAAGGICVGLCSGAEIGTAKTVIVAEEMCTGLRYFENLISEEAEVTGQIVDDIASRYLNINCACFTPNEGRMGKLAQLAKVYKVDGIIHCSLAFCDPYLIEANRVEKVLKEHNIPLLKIETDYGQEDSGQIKTRVEAFLEMIDKK